ncbi:hypothetical protein NKR23_g5956 [Pleurostoma richardsiae]|uniref:Steroid 5-alpha reductase C-terminal domain-containing protein n=1 Tax=Pleurostoma richardsiae TaxID=41990 RepID=A0AA38RCA3_9PEZI|nr:hypothetical protein NKR23_g5956 [Pleurostoma richardsiae]
MASVSNRNSAPQGEGKAPVDKIQRGNYTSSTAGTATWIGLRALDPILQYQLLANGWGPALLDKIGGSVIQLGSRFPGVTGSSGLLGGLKISDPPFNLLFDTTSSLLLLSSKTSAALKGPQIRIPSTDLSLPLPVLLGSIMFVVGSMAETLAELQRKRFKARPESKGRIYTGGLWRLARHINYGAYMMWRGGYMLAAGGLVPSVLLIAFLLRDFLSNSVRGMDEYMTQKYGQQWTRYKEDVPYKMFPGIF